MNSAIFPFHSCMLTPFRQYLSSFVGASILSRLTCLLLQCVIFYIRFENSDTKCLGVEGHICELQLALKSFVNIQVLPS